MNRGAPAARPAGPLAAFSAAAVLDAAGKISGGCIVLADGLGRIVWFDEAITRAIGDHLWTTDQVRAAGLAARLIEGGARMTTPVRRDHAAPVDARRGVFPSAGPSSERTTTAGRGRPAMSADQDRTRPIGGPR